MRSMGTAQALFSATLIAIMAAAGLVKGIDIAWIMAGITAGLAFFGEEVRRNGEDNMSFTAWVWTVNVLAILSWITGAIAGASLIIYS